MNKPIYLYITPFFPTPSHWQGGFSRDFVKAIMDDGRYDVIVLRSGAGDLSDYVYDGIAVKVFHSRELPSGVAPFLIRKRNERTLIDKLAAIGVSMADIAVCHANTAPFAVYPLALKRLNPSIKTVWQTHQMGAPINLLSGRLGVLPLHANILYCYYRDLLGQMDINLMLSEKHVREFGNDYPDGPLGRMVDMRSLLLFGKWLRKMELVNPYVLYNGIDTTVFNCNGRPRNGDAFTIGCIANFGPTKGQMTLLQALPLVKGIKNLKVIFVGTGETLKTCQEFVLENQLNQIVEFRKEVDHLALPDLYRSFDLFVLPTLREGFCCTLIEAAGCGAPIMSTRGVSIEEVIPVEDRDKWLIEPLNYRMLADKIMEFYSNRWQFRFNRDMSCKALVGSYLNVVSGSTKA